MEQSTRRGGDFTYSGTDNLEMMLEARNYNAFLVRMLAKHLQNRGEILDFGAGIGYFARRLQDAGFSITCVEADPCLAAQLATHGFVCLPSLDDAASDRFQAAYALNVLEHIEDDEAVLKQLHRVLIPQGTLVIYVPAFQILFSSMDKKVGHVRRYRASSLKRQMRAQGFQIVHSAYVDSLGFLATLLFRAVGNSRGDLNPLGLKIFDQFIFPLSRLLDRLVSCIVGKDLLVVAKKPRSECERQ